MSKGKLQIEYEKLVMINIELKERIEELEAGTIQVVADSNQAQIEASAKIRELEADNDRLRELLQAALPYIECKNNSQSGLITEIGEYLQQALKGGK